MGTGLSYFGCRRPEHLRGDLARLREEGWDYLVVPVTETDLLFYRDFIRELFREAASLGFGIWADPWGVAGIFSGETASWFVPYNPGTWQVRDDGVPVPHACPNAPGTADFIRRWVDFVASAGAEWILWDEPHFWTPGTDYWPGARGEGHWACRCRRCREGFRARYGEDMPGELTPEVRAFRRDSLLSFLEGILDYAKGKGLRNAVCWAPPPQLEGDLTLEGLAALPGLDVLAIDPYWMLVGSTPERFFVPWLSRAREAASAHGKELQVWLQGFRVPRGREGELLEGARIAAEAGAEYLAVWHHNGMSSLLPDDPTALEAVIRAIPYLGR